MNRLGIFLSASILFGAFLVAQGCKSTTGATDDEMICTPGAYVFCKCADTTKGTKLCREDGQSFEPCAAKASGECKGGEVKDKDTNKKVDGNGDVLPNQGDDDTDPSGPGELDVCPGKPISVPPGTPILLENDTSRAVNDRRGNPDTACKAALGSKDFIYHLIPSGKGSLEVKVQGQGALDPIAYIRTTCDDETTQAACGPQSGNKTATVRTNVRTGRDYFLFIDGASGGTGTFSAKVTLTAGNFCSDESVDEGEACDDGNHANGDGCNDNCRAVDGDTTAGNTCPGQPVDLWKGATVNGKAAFGINTTAYGNSIKTPNKATCATLPASGTNDGKDHIYKVTPHSAGTLTVTLSVQDSATPLSPDLFLSAHDTCAANAPTSSCSTGTTPMVLNVTANQPVFVVVDGATAVDQKYQISFNLK